MANTSMIDKLRADAHALFNAGVAAADPQAVTAQALEDARPQIEASDAIHIVAGGKAALAMMQAALDVVPIERIVRAIAVTNAENLQDGEAPGGVEAHAGGHPVPDAGGEAGARAIEDAVRAAKRGDLVICLISGGASALLPAPVEGVTLSDKIAATEALLRSGADIHAMNIVRTALSRLKGGGLARAAAPADVLGLLLSDVQGDDPATIGSGPTVPVARDPKAALAIIESHDLVAQMPAAVMQYLHDQAELRTDDGGFGRVENRVIGSNAISVEAVRRMASGLGYRPVTAADWLDGDVSDACARLLEVTSQQSSRPVAVIAGGETTVRVTGDGKGGRNQEMALRFALGAQKANVGTPWAMLSGGTDGRDGPTDAAGGLVDPHSLDRLAATGVDLTDHLARNDAYHALSASGDLLMTGATGTNVADLQIALLA